MDLQEIQEREKLKKSLAILTSILLFFQMIIVPGGLITPEQALATSGSWTQTTFTGSDGTYLDTEPADSNTNLKLSSDTTLLSHFDTSFNADYAAGNSSASPSGVLSFKEGKFSNGVFIEEGTTNLVKNANLEVDNGTNYGSGNSTAGDGFADGWSYTYSSGAAPTWTLDPDSVVGNYSQKIACAPTSKYYRFYQRFAVSSNTNYTVTAWIKSDENTWGYKISVATPTYYDSAAGDLGYATVSQINTWEKKTISFNTGSATEIQVGFWTGNQLGETLWIDAVQLEQKPYATSFVSENMVTNPSFENGTEGSAPTGWSTTDATFIKSSGDSYYGSYSLRVTGNDSANWTYINQQISTEPNKQYTISYWVRRTSDPTHTHLHIRHADGSNLISPGSYDVIGTSWEYKQATFTTGSSDTSIHIRIYRHYTSLGYTYFDGIKLEPGSADNGYSENNGSDQYNRLEAQLSYTTTSNISPSAGTVELWVKSNDSSNIWNDNSTHVFFGAQDSDTPSYNNRIFLYKDTSNNLVFFIDGFNDTDQSVTTSCSSFSQSSWYHLVGVWDSTEMRFYVNGSSVGTPISSPELPSVIDNKIAIGMHSRTDGGNLYQANATIDEVKISNRVRTAAEIQKDYQSTTPLTAPYPESGTYVSDSYTINKPLTFNQISWNPTSQSFQNWSKSSSNPILDLGTSGSWDDYHVYTPRVIKDGTTYKMWYSGYDGSNWRIGYATSSDGVAWTKYGSNPVLDLGADTTWDDKHVHGPAVIKDDTEYKMWYAGHDGSNWHIGYATSSDGVAWTKYGSNPVLDLGTSGSWDDAALIGPYVIKDGTTYKMWYAGYDGSNWRIGYATSSDGVAWTKSASNPVLDLGATDTWDDSHVYYPSVIKDGTTYKMWYSGNDGTNVRIGYATSSDGVAWTKYGSNPVLDLGTLGSFDDKHVYTACVIKDNTDYKMWYGGHDGSNVRIGYAEIKPSLKFQIATNNDNATWNFVGPDGTASTYYTTASGENIWSGHNGDKYVKYKVYLSSGNANYTPTLEDVTITYDYDADTPSVPQNLQASAVSSSQINLSWDTSTDTGGSGLDHYVLQRSTQADFSSGVSQVNVTPSGGPTESYSDDGTALGALSSNTTYYYRVKAVDGASNESDWSTTNNWWDTNYGYRKPVTIDNTGNLSTLTDYQVLLDSEENVVGDWHLDENIGTTANDSSGNGNNGTLLDADGTNADGNTPPQWTTGKYGSGLQFDGTDDHVRVPSDTSMDNNGEISIELWTKLIAESGYGYELVNRYYTTGANRQFILRINTSEQLRLVLSADGTNTHSIAFTDYTFQKNTWYHIVVTYDGSYGKLYVNGSLIQAVADSGGMINSVTADIEIGRYIWGGTPSYLNGVLDEVKIYNKALPQNEAEARYNDSFWTQVNSDGSDIRFTDDTSTEIPYWIEEWNNSSTTKNYKIWTKVPSIPASSTKDIYMYYGNASATSESNADNTLEFLEDFEDGDYSDWNIGSYYSLVDETSIVKRGSKSTKVTISPNSGFYGSSRSFTTLSEGSYRAEYWFYLSQKSEDDTRAGFSSFKLDFDRENDTSCYWYYPGGSTDTNVVLSTGQWYRTVMEIDQVNDSLHAWVEDSNENMITNTEKNINYSGSDNIGSASLYQDSPNSTVIYYLDNFLVRKYTSPEPTTSLGTEASPRYTSETTLCGTPQSPQATALSTTEINPISWDAPTGGADHYHVYSSSDGYTVPIYDGALTSTSESGLSTNTQYTYRIYAVNSSNEESVTYAEVSKYTLIETPTGISFDTINPTSIAVSATGSLSNLTSGLSGLYFENITAATNSGWIQINSWTSTLLSIDTSYSFRVKARNGDGTETTFTSTSSKYTAANQPGTPTTSAVSTTSLNVIIDENSNPSSVTYAIQETSSGNYVNKTTGALQAGEDWGTYVEFGSTSGINVTGLSANTQYTFKVKARNSELLETLFGGASSKYTLCNVPTSPQATAASVSSIDPISWTAPTGGADHYHVYSSSDGYTIPIYDGALTSCSESLLSSNTQYTYRIYSVNADNQESATYASVSKYTLSDDPTGATASDDTYPDKIAVSWVSGGSENHFHVYRDGLSGTGTLVYDNSLTSFDDTITGSHTYYVYSVNGDNEESSGYSSDSGSTLSAPDAPTIGTPSALSTTSIRWNFTDNASNEDGFKVHDSAHTTMVQNATPNLSYLDETSLAPNTQYTRHVHAYNGQGDSAPSLDALCWTLANPPTSPASASGDWDSTDNYHIDIIWTSGGAEDHFHVYSSSDGYTTPIYDGALTSAKETLLSANTTYTYRIYAVNGEDVENSSYLEVSATTPPAQVTGLSHTSNTVSSIVWSWTAIPEATSYEIHRNSDDAVIDTSATNSYTQTTSDGSTPLSANTQYSIHVHAVNTNGTGANSTSSSAYTSIETPTGISFDTINSTSLVVSASGTLSNLSSGSSGLYFENTTAATNSGWIQVNSWTSSPLQVNTSYSFRVKARNGDSDETSYTVTSDKYTAANVPGIPTVSSDWDTSSDYHSDITLDTGGNPAGTYFAVTPDDGTSWVQSDGTLAGTEYWSTSSSWLHKNLLANTTYSYKAKAKNGDNLETVLSSAGQDTTPPAAPTLGSFSHTNTETSVFWNWGDVTAATGYLLHDSSEGLIADVAGSEHNESLLQANTLYIRHVHAYNSNGTGAPSSSYEAYTSIEQPTGITFGTVGETSIEVSATGTFSNLLAGNSGILLTAVGVGTSGWAQNNNPYTFSPLSPNTQYSFTAKARNGDSDETLSTAESIKWTLASAPTSPASASGDWDSTDNYHIDIIWTSGGAEDHFHVYSSSDGYTTPIYDGALTSAKETLLSANTTYTYRIYAVNGEDVENSSYLEVSATTPPAAPASLTHTTNTTTSITWDWADVVGATGYKIHASNDGEKGDEAVSQCTESSLQANTLYTRHIHAYNTNGTGAPCSSVSAYTSIEQPTGASFSQVTTTSITVSAAGTISNLSSGSSGIYFRETVTSTNSGWLQVNSWTLSSLSPNTQYSFYINTRNGDSDVAGEVGAYTKYTLSDNPTGATASNGTYSDKIVISWSSGGTEDHFRIYRDGPAGQGSQVYNGSGTSFEDTTTGTHTYYIYSVNGEGALSSSYASCTGKTKDAQPSPSPSPEQPPSQNGGGTSNSKTSSSASSSVSSSSQKQTTTTKIVLPKKVKAIGEDGVSYELKPDKNGEVKVLEKATKKLTIKVYLKGAVAALVVIDGKAYNLTNVGNGYFEGEIETPEEPGSYEVVITQINSDGTQEQVKTMTLLVDPYGYVYDKESKARIVNATVTLYEYNKKKNSWQIWNAKKYKQKNPQETNDNGDYGFMVPKGKYYITCSAPGYKSYKSKTIKISSSHPVTLNIGLEPEGRTKQNPTTRTLYIWIAIAFVLGLGLGIGGFFLRKKLPSRKEK